MLQLVYTSTAAPDWDGDLKALCERGARNNARDEITGVLIYQDGTFLHALEGPMGAVEDTFLRIIVDPRHHSLALLSRKKSTSREFGHGAMALLKTDEERRQALDKVRRIVATNAAAAQAAFEKHFK